MKDIEKIFKLINIYKIVFNIIMGLLLSNVLESFLFRVYLGWVILLIVGNYIIFVIFDNVKGGIENAN